MVRGLTLELILAQRPASRHRRAPARGAYSPNGFSPAPVGTQFEVPNFGKT